MTTTPLAVDSRAMRSAAKPLARAEPAGSGLVAAGVCLAAVEVGVLGAAVAIAFTTGGAGAGGAALVAAVVAVAIDVAFWVRAGQGLAWRIVGIMLLARTDDAPLGFGRLLPMPPSWVAATRGKRHPVDVRLDPFVLSNPDPMRGPRHARAASLLAPASAALAGASPTDAASPAGEDPRGAPPEEKPSSAGLAVLPPGMQREEQESAPRAHRGPVRVTVDGQSRHVLTGTAIVGRRPVAAVDGHGTIEVTDLTRTLSKNHLRLEVESDGALFVTDLGSTNGSAIVTKGGLREELIPHAPAPLELHDTVTLGDHRLTFSQGGGS